MSNDLQVAVVIGSTREGHLGTAVARWFMSQATQRSDMSFDVIELADAQIPAAVSFVRSPEVEHFADRIRDADAVIVVTPEYNHGYPASLKAAIDALRAEWHAKPIALVSYGGMSGGIRAVEQLRQVFAEVHATTIRDGVAFVGVFDQFDDNGNLRDPEPANGAAKVMLDRLAWWAHALRDAREIRPYAV